MSKFLRRILLIFIIKIFRTIVFIFIVISTTFRLICPPAFFRCLSNSGIFSELRTTSFIETTGVACSNSVSHNRVQVLSSDNVVQVQSSLQASNNTGIFNTCTRLWPAESEQATLVVSIKDVVRSSMKVPEFDKHLKKAGGHIGRNVVKITIKIKTIVRKTLMIKKDYLSFTSRYYF